MVLDEVVWYFGLGGKVAIFDVRCGLGDVDGAHRHAFGSGLGWFVGGSDVGYFAVSGDVQ